ILSHSGILSPVGHTPEWHIRSCQYGDLGTRQRSLRGSGRLPFEPPRTGIRDGLVARANQCVQADLGGASLVERSTSYRKPVTYVKRPAPIDITWGPTRLSCAPPRVAAYRSPIAFGRIGSASGWPSTSGNAVRGSQALNQNNWFGPASRAEF